MHCEWVERHLSAFHDGALDKATADQVRAHLANCPDCSAILADYGRLDVTLKRMPRVSPSPALRDRIFSAPEFRELVQPRRAENHPPATITPFPTVHKAGNVARLVTSIAAVLVIASGVGLLYNSIFAHQRSGPLYAACPAALSSGPRLVYRVGGTLYSGADKLVCDSHAQVGAGWQVSPDGHWVAYVDTARGELRVVRANATGNHAIDSGAGTLSLLAWSPDSQRLFIVQQTGNQQYTLSAADPNQATAQIIAHVAVGTVTPHLAISPDGRYVALQATFTSPNADAYLMVFDTMNPGAIAHTTLMMPALDFGWTPADQFTWLAPVKTGGLSVSLATPDLTAPQTVAAPVGVITAAVNAQGVWAFAHADGTITTYDALTQRQATLARLGPVDRLVWSPSGASLAAVSHGALYLVTPTGANQAAADAGAYPPTWSADSATLTFGGPDGLQTLDVATGAIQPLTLAGIPAEMPAWSQAQ